MKEYFKVAAFQGTFYEGNEERNLDKIIQTTRIAESQNIDILSFPECFLHGYFSEKEKAYRNAVDLKSTRFKDICNKFLPFKSITVLFGLNEIDQNQIYNTVVVIENGKFKGKYRKAYTYAPYDYYALGREFPIFEKQGIKYGIIICLDSNYREPAHIAALKGAQIIFCPSFNRVSKDAKMLHYLNRKSHFISRAFDNQCWFIASDIIWESDQEICPGYSCILSDNGEIVAKAEPFHETILTYAIPLHTLQNRKLNRIYGKPELFEIISQTYKNIIR